MKKEILWAFVFGILIGTVALGDEAVGPNEPSVSASVINPVLKTIGRLSVLIESEKPGPDGRGDWQELKPKIEKRLKDAGVTVVDAAYSGKPSKNKVRPEMVSVFRIKIDRLKLADYKQPVFRVESVLAKKTFLQKKPPHLLKLKVWSMCGTGYTGVEQAEMSVVTNLALSQVDSFVSAYTAAKGAAGVQTRIKSSPSGTETAPLRYISSKESRIFHRPECPWVARISPRNLVVHKNRFEATKARKRPCKRCKP